MAENYIHIFTSELSDLYQDRKLTFKQTYQLLQDFEKVCRNVKNREDLIGFIAKEQASFPQLQTLKDRLGDKTFVFPAPPENGV